MLDSTTIRARLDTAIDTLTANLAELFSAEMERQAAIAPSTKAAPKEPPKAPAPKASPAATKPKPAVKKATPIAAKLKPLLGRANVHVVPSQAKAPPAPNPMSSQYEPAIRKGPAPEEIAKKAERIVMASSLPPTFERIRRALRVSKAALAPVIDQLVENKKICMVDVGGVILFKPPRIEPIRRRRADRPVASGQGL